MKDLNESPKLRDYVLGSLPETEISSIEERLMGDDEFFQELSMTEEDLVQDYVDGNLDRADRENFEKRFLATEENRQKVMFARALRKYVDENKSEPQTQTKSGFFDAFRAFFLSPVPVAGGILVILVISGLLVWKNFTNQSPVLTALNNAYRTERPFDARITDFDYAPPKNTRGGTGAAETTDKIERDLAKTLALKAVSENPSAENHHALGRVYLLEKNFAEAIEQFEKAVKISPPDAELHNDFGAALMEKGRSENSFEQFAGANEEFGKAIKLNNALSAAYFNKGLCLELMSMPNQAKEAWREYLKLDSSSPWAEEARKKLQFLEERQTSEISAETLEQEFTKAFLQKKNDEAWQLVSQTRELISEKYLPQRLAMSITAASGKERVEKLQTLEYLGGLEKERIGDRFAADLADFYARAGEEKFDLLKKAQAAVREGYKLSLEGNFSKSLEQFETARAYFLKTGNLAEAEAICRHFIAYCLYRSDRRAEALKIFDEVDKFSREKNYKWLYSLNFYWLIGWNYAASDYKSITRVKEEYQKGLEMSQAMNDSYMTQKYLAALALRCSLIKQEKEMLGYLQKLYESSDRPNVSVRQKFRNFSNSVEMLSSTRYDALSTAVALEGVKLAEDTKDPLFPIYSQIDAGIVHTQTGDFDEARKWFEQAETAAAKVSEESERKYLQTRSYLKWGHLERKTGNYGRAAELYEAALKILETTKAGVALYETQKSRLLAYQALGDDTEVEKQLSAVLKFAEDYRDKISEEQERHAFFDNEQTIYDVAVEHEIRLGKNEAAYNYAEISNSRSLLDWLKKGATVLPGEETPEILFSETAKPLAIGEIREKMPAEAQILQYTVLEKKVLIWLVSKDKFVVARSEISADELDEKVSNYLTLILSKDASRQTEAQQLGTELYQILISPILSSLDAGKQICLIPDKLLFRLPFAALFSPDGKYFLEEYAFIYAPSANVFILCTENAAKKSGSLNETLLSVGNPKFNAKQFSDLPDLPSAETESREIAGYYETAEVLLGQEATKKSFREFYQTADVIHFAGHYLVRQGSPLFSSLILADSGGNADDSVLTNAEIIREKLVRPKLVVLSACQTGVEEFRKSEGLIGLTRTFLASGVPLVVASGWQVDSEATAELMKNFHRYRRQEKLPTAEALRRAQTEMLGGREEKFRQPYYWAAFASFGAYAKF